MSYTNTDKNINCNSTNKGAKIEQLQFGDSDCLFNHQMKQFAAMARAARTLDIAIKQEMNIS